MHAVYDIDAAPSQHIFDLISCLHLHLEIHSRLADDAFVITLFPWIMSLSPISLFFFVAVT